MQIRVLILSILISLPILIYSQDHNSIDSISCTKGIGFRIYSGAIIPHETPLRPLKKGNVKAFELNYSFNRIDNKTWHSYYNYPEVGISYMFMDLGYKDVLGYSHSIYPYIVFPFTKRAKQLSLSLKVALGLSYITKTYDSISNSLDIAISTPINLYACLGLNLNYRLSSKISANIGIYGTHFSNGSIKKPNYGLNILTGSFGIHYNFNQLSRIPKTFTNFEIDKSKWVAILSGGIKETNKPGGSKYRTGSISIEYSKPFKKPLRYGVTFDYMFDGSTLVHFREDSVPYQSQLKASKLGLTLMGEMKLYRLSAFGNFGAYLYNHDKQNKAIYQRIGLRYRLSKSIYTQIALKTHLNVADYIEFGIAYKFKQTLSTL